LLGEYQPVYEEFGYILLLVLTIIYRYSFTALDLTHTHAPNNEAFIPQLLHQFTAAQRIETISSSDQHAQLGGWIKELFENEGISDGPMMACRPQEFYKLVPTIFSQSLLALERGVVDIGAVKDAFAFLLTPFLLPSVVSGLSWLSQHLWSHLDAPHNDLQILASLIIAPGLAPETAETHRTVISIAARPLDAVLRDLLSRPDAAPDARVTAQELLTHIKPHLNFKRSGYPTREEMDNWMHSAGSGGLTTTLVNSFNNLLAWSNNTASRSATYTHSLLLASWKLLGARRVVEALIAEAVKNRVSNTTVAGMAEDLVVSFVCACVIHEDCGGRLKLIDALKALEEDHTANKSIIFYDSCDEDIKGEITLSVLRRVEAQIIPYPSIQHHHDHDRQHDVEMNSVSMGMVNMGGVDAVIGQSIADDGMGDLMMGGDFVTGMLDENTHMNI
jgi:mediator of RNA polymerase II transcription subunit 5